ncbi:MAG: GNAT family N-acetyltransferase [bacterium]|nr:GNAT family N-acetyltransferase [bacterium]
MVLGSRVVLRPLTERDVPLLFRIFSDPEVMRYWSHPPFTSESEALAYLGDVRQGFESKTLFQWGLCRRGDRSVIGTCTLWQLDASNRRAEVGFVLAREHWGQGFMTEGLAALIDFSFGDLRLRRLEADVDPANEASIALLERLGFVREGYLRERWLVGSEVADSLFYGLLEREWSKRRNA